jgi:hypothetical protein
MSTKFKRTIEDFICEHCGRKVKGNGYTNHCPHCLWSKHVDINPGDREADCGGLMEPIDVELKKGLYIIKQKCVKCGHFRRNKVCPEDDFQKILELSKNKFFA